jgi:hypothetical protein
VGHVGLFVGSHAAVQNVPVKPLVVTFAAVHVESAVHEPEHVS